MRAAIAIAVARRLIELARSRTELLFLEDLVSHIMKLLYSVPEGKVATNAQCSRFIDEYASYFGAGAVKAALRAIEESNDVPSMQVPRNPNAVEYRMERPVPYAPFASYGPRRGTGRSPVDDISERIAIAVDAMKEAGCGRPVASVVDSMRETSLIADAYCTNSHVTSRMRALGQRIPETRQESPKFLTAYWHSLHPSMTVADLEWPERFEFMQCDC